MYNINKIKPPYFNTNYNKYKKLHIINVSPTLFLLEEQDLKLIIYLLYRNSSKVSRIKFETISIEKYL